MSRTHPKDDPGYSHLYEMRTDAAEYGQTMKPVEAEIDLAEARYELGQAFQKVGRVITLIAGGAFLGATFGPLWAVVGALVGLGLALWTESQRWER